MKIIREPNSSAYPSPTMIARLRDWHVCRCNVEGCQHRPNTIITGASKEEPVIGLCEQHYQAYDQSGDGIEYTFIFDDFDTLKERL